MKELTRKIGMLDPQGCHPENRSSAGMSEMLAIYDKTKWMPYLSNTDGGDMCCLELQAP